MSLTKLTGTNNAQERYNAKMKNKSVKSKTRTPLSLKKTNKADRDYEAYQNDKSFKEWKAQSF